MFSMLLGFVKQKTDGIIGQPELRLTFVVLFLIFGQILVINYFFNDKMHNYRN
jgi:hypothetical protein